MRQYDTGLLTEDALVTRLHELGYTDVTKRRVATWRAQEVIPCFDVIGAGRGQSLGRESSGWSNGVTVVQQAAEVYSLLKKYHSLAELRFPLWVLGYPIPLTQVREELSRPLDSTMELIQTEGGSRGEIEDKIGDDVFEFSQMVARSNLMPFPVPQEAIETFSNLFLNSRYDLTDTPFEDGVKALKEFDDAFQQKAETVFAREFSDKPQAQAPNGNMYAIFAHAAFINEHLSVEKLKLAVDDCSDEDLLAVQCYLQAGREIVDLLKELTKLLQVHLPFELQPSELDPTIIFTAAKLCVWASLSLRRNGYGELIEACLAEILKELPRQLDGEIRRELQAAGPEIARSLEICFEQLMGISFPSQQTVGR